MGRVRGLSLALGRASPQGLVGLCFLSEAPSGMAGSSVVPAGAVASVSVLAFGTTVFKSLLDALETNDDE